MTPSRYMSLTIHIKDQLSQLVLESAYILPCRREAQPEVASRLQIPAVQLLASAGVPYCVCSQNLALPQDCICAAQGMLQTSRQTLQELHNVCGPKTSRLWADRTLGLTRFGSLRSLTLCEHPSLCAHWLSRLPLSLQSLKMIGLSSHQRLVERENGYI